MIYAIIEGTWSVSVTTVKEAVASHANDKSDDDKLTIQQPAAGSERTDLSLKTILS